MSALNVMATSQVSLRPFFGEHPSVRQLLERVTSLAPLRDPVLLVGETGTGKEILASRLHQQSGRRGRYVAENAAAIPESLAEAELFGVRRGAFTGAQDSRDGMFRRAHEGTLYLDEASDLSSSMQARMLRILESGLVRPVGGQQEELARPRLVLSIQQGPGELVAVGRWRRDFMHRVAGAMLLIPPLRERDADAILLAKEFLRLQGRHLLVEGQSELLRYGWPGNVRELESAVRRAALSHNEDRVSAAEIVESARLLHVRASSVGQLHRDSDRARIVEALAAAAGNVEAAAVVLKVSRATLYRWMKALLIVSGRGVSGFGRT